MGIRIQGDPALSEEGLEPAPEPVGLRWNDPELVKMVTGGIPFHMDSDQAGNVWKLGRPFMEK